MATLFSPTSEASPSLPITEFEQLRTALAQSDPSILLMVLTHFSRGEPFLEQFSPYITSVFDTPKETPETLLSELRERLFQVLTQVPPPDRSPISPFCSAPATG